MRLNSASVCTIWRAFNDSFYGYGDCSEKRITNSSLIRLQRAQLRLAGIPVEGWPWPEYCKCTYQDAVVRPFYPVWHCENCGKAKKP